MAKDSMQLRLHLRGVAVTGVVTDLPEVLVVAVVALVSWVRCHRCRAKCFRVHQTKTVQIRDLACHGRPTTLNWARRRFSCGRCGATTTEPAPAGFLGRYTRRFVTAVIADVAVMTVQAARKRHGLSWHTVMGLVLAHGWQLGRHRRRRPCRVLVVDEKTLRKGMNNFSTIVTCGVTGTVLAVLEGRSGVVLARWLRSQPPRWRRGVQVVVTDMAASYRAGINGTTDIEITGVVRRCLPHAAHIADRFHVVRNFMRIQGDVRRALQAHKAGRSRRDPALFQSRYLQLKRCDRLSTAETTQLMGILADQPALAAAWELTQRFHAVMQAPDIEVAMAQLEGFVDAYARCARSLAGVDPSPQIRTILRWQTEIFNYHRHGRWTTNVAEGTNNKIEVLERMAYGFRSRANYTARVLLVCQGHPNRAHAV